MSLDKWKFCGGIILCVSFVTMTVSNLVMTQTVVQTNADTIHKLNYHRELIKEIKEELAELRREGIHEP